MTQPQLVEFRAGTTGEWAIDSIRPVTGESLPVASRLTTGPGGDATAWCLRGVVSHERYVTAAEQRGLRTRQPPLGRPTATRAALIPIRKTAAWWSLAQDDRRAIFEERSHHIGTGVGFLPAVARRLHHGRDLGEPFDFLTWFEYAEEDATAFEDLVSMLRGTEEWSYVDREVDVRLTRAAQG